MEDSKNSSSFFIKYIVSFISVGHAKDLRLSFFAGIFAGLFVLFPLFHNGISLSLFLVATVILLMPVITMSGLVIGILLSERVPQLLQLVKFGTVGGLNAFLELTIVNVLIFMTGATTGVYFSLFKAMSFFVAVMSSYFWNKYWVFESKTVRSGNEFFKFIGVTVIGLIINVGVASFLVNSVVIPFGVGELVWVNIAVLVAVFVAMTWNFLSMKLIIFKE